MILYIGWFLLGASAGVLLITGIRYFITDPIMIRKDEEEFGKIVKKHENEIDRLKRENKKLRNNLNNAINANHNLTLQITNLQKNLSNANFERW